MEKFASFVAKHKAECVCFALFIASAIFGFCVHEPWYDEAQAWQIAKTASLHDIVFVIPHWEGHPPFWHLFLAIPAKLGMPWQWAFPLLGMSFLLVNGFLLFFKAPFPRWVRCLLPFNYFLLWQYGVIFRPYSAMILVILLLAIYFPQKDKRPYLFTGLLAALCACHLFGIALAGGITMAWLWEIKAQRSWGIYLKQLVTDKRFYGMLVLLAWAILLLAAIWRTDGFLNGYRKVTVSWVRYIIYLLFCLPAEAVLTDLNDSLRLMTKIMSWKNLLITSAIGISLWGSVFYFFPRKKWLYLVLPYVLLVCILSQYGSCHHIGVVLLLFIWYIWISIAHTPLAAKPRILCNLGKGLLALVLCVPIGWSLTGMYNDYRYVVFPGKEIVSFLKNRKLMQAPIFGAWTMLPGENPDEFKTSPHSQPNSVLLNMYLKRNIIDNFHDGENRCYLVNDIPTQQEAEAIFERWRKLGLPAVLLGAAAIPHLYGDLDLEKHYKVSYVGYSYSLWKFQKSRQPLPIYLHRDIWEQLSGISVKEFEHLKQQIQHNKLGQVPGPWPAI